MLYFEGTALMGLGSHLGEGRNDWGGSVSGGYLVLFDGFFGEAGE